MMLLWSSRRLTSAANHPNTGRRQVGHLPSSRLLLLPLLWSSSSSSPSSSMARRTIHKRHSTNTSLEEVVELDVVPRTTSDSTTNAVPTPPAAPRKFVSFPFSYHQILTVEVESLTNRGWGIARVNLDVDSTTDHDTNTDTNSSYTESSNSNKSNKWVIMVVPGAIPGERVNVRIFRNFPKYSEADLLNIVEESEHRVNPLCPAFVECGGCQYQHMSIQYQRQWKTKHVQEAMQQYNMGDDEVAPCLGTDEIYHYRSKLTPHYEAPSSGRRRNNSADDSDGGDCNPSKRIQAIGFQKQTSRQIVDVTSCVIATDPINVAYQRVREQLLSPPESASMPTSSTDNNQRRRKNQNKGATLLLRQANSDDSYVATNHQESLITNVLGKNFTYLAGNFFQNNYYVLPLMVQHVVDAASQPITLLDGNNIDSNPTAYRSTPPTHLVDCYCGSGLFAISASEHFETIVGIEINDRAIEEATSNAQSNNITNCQFVAATAEHIFQQLSSDSYPRDSTVVVLDPPRKGCSESFVQQLLDFQPARIVYLSCDPTTQARDVKMILDYPNTQYVIESVQPFDLFPMTRHIECLVVLNRHGSVVETSTTEIQ